MLVFKPVSASELAAWAAGARPSGAAYAATPAFLSAFGLESAPDAEDAERTLLYVAGLDALLAHGARLVAVAEAAASDLGTELGLVETGPIGWDAVTALFADEPQARADVAARRAGLAGVDLATAWEEPAHERLLADHDLLWYGPEEWAVLAQG